jgi:serine protease Do
VVGVNTAIISPSGGSIGIGFSVPSKIVVGVIDQLRQFGETRRGWLGVRIQPVTPEIGDSLNIKPARGALIAGLDDKGPAKPAGIEPGDVIVTFDGHDIKDMRDLPRIVADTPVGKDVEDIVIRDGKELKKTVKLARLEDGEKQAALTPKKDQQGPDEKSTVKKTLGLEIANLSDDLRKRFNIQAKVKGVIITAVEPNSSAAEKRLTPGTVIVSVQQQTVSNAADLQARIDKLKKEGKKTAVFLVANGSGDTTFVALSLQ